MVLHPVGEIAQTGDWTTFLTRSWTGHPRRPVHGLAGLKSGKYANREFDILNGTYPDLERFF